jgi:hypothetical protein
MTANVLPATATNSGADDFRIHFFGLYRGFLFSLSVTKVEVFSQFTRIHRRDVFVLFAVANGFVLFLWFTKLIHSN